MTAKQADEIRRLVDAKGWQAVREHPILGPVWSATVKEQREYERKIVEPC